MFPKPKIRDSRDLALCTLCVVFLCLNAYWYYVWRMDMPPHNPGGQVGSMGFGVKMWSFSVHISAFLMVPTVARIIQLLTRGNKKYSQTFVTRLEILILVVLFAPILMPGRYPLPVGIAAFMIVLLGVPTILHVAGQKTIGPPTPSSER
jgi:hypothetical protein